MVHIQYPFFYEFLSNITLILTPICHSCSLGSFSLTRWTRYCRPQLMNIAISWKDKHIYTDIDAYLEIYENVKVTTIRQLAMVILIRSSRPSIRCPRMPTRTLSTNALTLGTIVPRRFRFHTRLKSIHEYKSYPQSRPTRQSFTVKLCRTGFPITADRFPTEQTSKMSVRCCHDFMSRPCRCSRFFRS